MAGDSSRFTELVKHGEMGLSLGKVDELRRTGLRWCATAYCFHERGRCGVPPAPAPPKPSARSFMDPPMPKPLRLTRPPPAMRIIGGKIGQLGRGTTEVTRGHVEVGKRLERCAERWLCWGKKSWGCLHSWAVGMHGIGVGRAALLRLLLLLTMLLLLLVCLVENVDRVSATVALRKVRSLSSSA